MTMEQQAQRFKLIVSSKDGDQDYDIYDNQRKITLGRKILNKSEGLEAVGNLNFLHSI